MPVDTSKTVAGVDDFEARLRAAMRDVAIEGAKAVRDKALLFAPERSGELKSSIAVDPAGAYFPRYSLFTALVGPTVSYGRIRELGGRVPRIAPVRWLHWKFGDQDVFWNVADTTIKNIPIRGPERQQGTHYMRRAVQAVTPRYRDMLIKRVRAVIAET